MVKNSDTTNLCCFECHCGIYTWKNTCCNMLPLISHILSIWVCIDRHITLGSNFSYSFISWKVLALDSFFIMQCLATIYSLLLSHFHMFIQNQFISCPNYFTLHNLLLTDGIGVLNMDVKGLQLWWRIFCW